MVNSQFNNSKINVCNESKVKIWWPLSQSKYLQVSFSCSHKSRQQDIKYLAFSKPLSGHKTVQNGSRNVKDIFKQPMYIYSLKRFYWKGKYFHAESFGRIVAYGSWSIKSSQMGITWWFQSISKHFDKWD